jgi:hypothetical protein
MPRHDRTGALRLGIVVILVVTGACGPDASQSDQQASDSASDVAAASSASATPASRSTATFTTADLDAYARGIAKEIELVRAAQEQARTATTPEARGAAAQAQWEDQTIPEGARSAGLEPERYRDIRKTVHHVFETLDFQGKVDGPMTLDTTRATPEMRQRLTLDPFEELEPSSRSALRERMDKLVPLFVQYVTLTAVAG